MTDGRLVALTPLSWSTQPLYDATLITAIAACFDCARQCRELANTCFTDPERHGLAARIRASFDCADVCLTTARELLRGPERGRGLRERLTACATACTSTAEVCASSGSGHSQLRRGEEACRACADACRALIAMVAG